MTRTFAQDGGMRVAAIGHGAQRLIIAGVLHGRTVACAPGIRNVFRAAGAVHRDEAVVRHANLIAVRGPDDLPAFYLQLPSVAPVRSQERPDAIS